MDFLLSAVPPVSRCAWDSSQWVISPAMVDGRCPFCTEPLHTDSPPGAAPLAAGVYTVVFLSIPRLSALLPYLPCRSQIHHRSGVFFHSRAASPLATYSHSALYRSPVDATLQTQNPPPSPKRSVGRAHSGRLIVAIFSHKSCNSEASNGGRAEEVCVLK